MRSEAYLNHGLEALLDIVLLQDVDDTKEVDLVATSSGDTTVDTEINTVGPRSAQFAAVSDDTCSNDGGSRKG